MHVFQKCFPFIHAGLFLNDFMNIVQNALFIFFSFVMIFPVMHCFCNIIGF